MADFHKYKFVYAGNKKYSDGYDRIFGKKKKTQKAKTRKSVKTKRQTK